MINTNLVPTSTLSISLPMLTLLTKHPVLTAEAKLIWAYIGAKTEFNLNHTYRFTLREIIRLDSFLSRGMTEAITTLIQQGFLSKIDKEGQATAYALSSPKE